MQNHNIFLRGSIFGGLATLILIAAFVGVAILYGPTLSQLIDDPEGTVPDKLTEKDKQELAKDKPELAKDKPELAKDKPELAKDKPELAKVKDKQELAKVAFFRQDKNAKDWMLIRLTAKQYNQVKAEAESHEAASPDVKTEASDVKTERFEAKTESSDVKTERSEAKAEHSEAKTEREEVKPESLPKKSEEAEATRSIAVILTPRQQMAIQQAFLMEKPLYKITLQTGLKNVFYANSPDHQGYYIARAKEAFGQFLSMGNEKDGCKEISEATEQPNWSDLFRDSQVGTEEKKPVDNR